MVNAKNISFVEPIIHLLFWMIFISFIFDFGGLTESFWRLFVDGEKMIDDAFVIIPILVAIFYWNLLVLIPRFLSRGQWVPYSLSVVISFILIYALAGGIYLLLSSFGYYFFVDSFDFLDQLILFIFPALIASSTIGVGKIAFVESCQKEGG